MNYVTDFVTCKARKEDVGSPRLQISTLLASTTTEGNRDG